MFGVAEVATYVVTAGVVAAAGIVSGAVSGAARALSVTEIEKPKAQPARRRVNHTDLCTVWQNTFGEVFTAKCKLCERKELTFAIRTGDNAWEVSHVIPFTDGGSDDISNLRPLCRSCNRSMGSRSFKDYIAENYPNKIERLTEVFKLA